LQQCLLTPDIGGTAKTADVTNAVVEFITSKATVAETA
jgi:tartrate dehydrogenase/decarboxylase/D-malate dehydrogenase